jgi:membrane protein implicated in regulation of membrane protease activity
MLASTWMFLLAWFNLPFSLLFLLALLLGGMQLLGVSGEHDTDADSDLDSGLDHDLDADTDLDLDDDLDFEQDLDLEHDLDLDHDIDLDHDWDANSDANLDSDAEADGDLAAGPNADDSLLSALAFLGVGKAPLMLVLLILCGFTGLSGWTLNGFAQSLLGGYPAWAFVLVLPLAMLVGGTLSSNLARLIGRALPPVSTTAVHEQALVGRRGTVVSPRVDETYGQVHVRDAGGTLMRVFAVVKHEPPIENGEAVVLVDFDPGRRCFVVTRLALSGMERSFIQR